MHGRIFDYRRRNFRSSSRWNAKVRCEKCVENDQPSDILRVAHCILQREGSPPIMNDQNYIPESHGPLRPAGSRSLRLHSEFRDRRFGPNAPETANPQSTATPALSSGQMPSDTNDECNEVRISNDIGVL